MAFAALGVIWGVPYFFIKIALQELSPLVVAWGRLFLAALGPLADLSSQNRLSRMVPGRLRPENRLCEVSMP